MTQINPLSNVDDVYGGVYQSDSVSDVALASFASIARVLHGRYNPASAIDVGCGGGALVRGFTSLGVDAFGIEGSGDAVGYLPGRIFLHDLRRPWTGLPKYDLVTCFDVAEHLEEEFADTLVDTLTLLAGEMGVVLFGAAPPGQSGVGHVNCRPPEYWREKFVGRGFWFFPRETRDVRDEINLTPGTEYRWWVGRNLEVFRPILVNTSA